MANAHDLAQVLNEMHERSDALREGFGVVESDFQKLTAEDGQFKFEELATYHADVEHLEHTADIINKDTQELDETLNQHLETDLRQHIAQLTEAITTAASTLHDHANQHQEAHHELQQEATQFIGDTDHAIHELDSTKNQVLQHVQQMSHTLGDTAEKASHSASALGDSVHQTQTEALNKAHESFHEAVGKHSESTIPQLLEQGLGLLSHGAESLDGHCNSAGESFKQELEQLIKDLGEYAVQQVESEIEAKFKHLIEEVVKFLIEQIVESIAMTVAGAATTAAMAEILPEMILLKDALEAIRGAIEIFKALKDLL